MFGNTPFLFLKSFTNILRFLIACTVIHLMLRQFNRLTSLVEALLISVRGELSRIKPEISISMSCRAIKLSIK